MSRAWATLSTCADDGRKLAIAHCQLTPPTRLSPFTQSDEDADVGPQLTLHTNGKGTIEIAGKGRQPSGWLFDRADLDRVARLVGWSDWNTMARFYGRDHEQTECQIIKWSAMRPAIAAPR